MEVNHLLLLSMSNVNLLVGDQYSTMFQRLVV